MTSTTSGLFPDKVIIGIDDDFRLCDGELELVFFLSCRIGGRFIFVLLLEDPPPIVITVTDDGS